MSSWWSDRMCEPQVPKRPQQACESRMEEEQARTSLSSGPSSGPRSDAPSDVVPTGPSGSGSGSAGLAGSSRGERRRRGRGDGGGASESARRTAPTPTPTRDHRIDHTSTYSTGHRSSMRKRSSLPVVRWHAHGMARVSPVKRASSLACSAAAARLARSASFLPAQHPHTR